MVSQPLSFDAGWSQLLALSEEKLDTLCKDLKDARATTSFRYLAQLMADHLGLCLNDVRNVIYALAACRNMGTQL
jgi:hypothetical protein